MLFLMDLAIGAGSGLVLSVPVLLWLEKKIQKKEEKKPWHTAGVLLFAFLLAGIITVTGVPAIYHFRFDANINMIPMVDIFTDFSQYFKNMLLFVPFGFLLPLLWKRERLVEKTVSIGFLFSLFIELIQLFSFRATDIDDLLMNTLGTWVGYLLFKVILKIMPGLCERFGAGEKPEEGSLWGEEDGKNGKGAEEREESPAARYEMELCFGIILFLMLTLQPLLSGALWEGLYH